MGNWCDSSCPFFVEYQMNKNALPIVSLVVSVVALVASVALNMNSNSHASPPAATAEEFKKSQSEINDRILHHAQDLSDTRQRFLQRDVDMSKRIGVLEEKAGITPQGN
jgi:hypothetical protein